MRCDIRLGTSRRARDVTNPRARVMPTRRDFHVGHDDITILVRVAVHPLTVLYGSLCPTRRIGESWLRSCPLLPSGWLPVLASLTIVPGLQKP